uniref:Uncharacterized protein n=1 Tax=viral metagenome TaxID=1070528 RepID=A0A6C0HAH9_9ZZZZ
MDLINDVSIIFFNYGYVLSVYLKIKNYKNK